MAPEEPFGPEAASPDEEQVERAAERSGVSFLLYRDGHGVQRIYELEDTATRKIRIGRAASADVLLSWDTKVSGLHAELEHVGDDWVLVDDGLSRNGTFANGERVQGRRRLRDRDTLRFGDTVAIYRAPPAGEYGETAIADPGD